MRHGGRRLAGTVLLLALLTGLRPARGQGCWEPLYTSANLTNWWELSGTNVGDGTPSQHTTAVTNDLHRYYRLQVVP
ncbi:MAG: hypothetical protein JXR37_17140 [Kiritimatiellae bacterium]|nr:hypothetical protein [Kiritimatiellia bacterium]